MQYVLGFMFDPGCNWVVLIEKLRPAWQKGRVNGVGGKMEPGETPVEAMVREFMEETGLLTDPDEWNHFLTLDHPGKYTMFVFRCQSEHWRKVETATDERVVIESARCFTRIPIDNLHWMIPMMLDRSLGNGHYILDVGGN